MILGGSFFCIGEILWDVNKNFIKDGRCGIFLFNKVNILFLFFLMYLFKVLIIIIIVLGIFCICCSGFIILKLKYFCGFFK